MSVAEERAGELFDMLEAGDLSSAEVCRRTGWTHGQFLQAVQTLRDICSSEGDVISVVAEPQGAREPWLYSLKAGTMMMDVANSRWIPNRLRDSERRLKTIVHVLDAASASLDGRSAPGRRSRIYGLHIHRAIEEVTMLGLDDD